MKLHSIPLLTLLFFSMDSLSQQNSDKKENIKFGLGFGANVTRASLASYIPSVAAYKNYTESHSRVGFDINAFLVVPINKYFSFQPTLDFAIYKQRQLYSNDSILDNYGSVSFSDKLTESVLSLEALFKYKTKWIDVITGPEMGFAINAEIKSLLKANASAAPQYYNEIMDFRKSKKVHDPIISWLFGLSKDYRKFGVGVYYRICLNDFTKYDDMRQISKVNGFLLRVGYVFDN